LAKAPGASEAMKFDIDVKTLSVITIFVRVTVPQFETVPLTTHRFVPSGVEFVGVQFFVTEIQVVRMFEQVALFVAKTVQSISSVPDATKVSVAGMQILVGA
jgi:hypothetical protein